jgi:nitroreductase
LQAAELGLGTCIMGWFDEKKVKKLLGIKGKRVPLLISLGYPAGETRKKARKSLEEMSSWNQY